MIIGKKYPVKFTSLIIALITLNSCSIFEPASPVASYIHIDSIYLITDYPTQGSSSSKITDAWILYDNVYLGTFPLPADIPLIGEGPHSLIIKAGVINNGISGTRSSYAKYSSFDTTIVLTANQKVSISPFVTYGNAIEFPQIEDFDDASLSLSSSGNGNTPLEISQQSDSNSFEGNSGIATLNDTNTIFEVASAAAFALPLSVPTYLELNYKCDIDFDIGVYITSTGGILKVPLLSVRASSEWKKIYVGLSDLGGVSAGGIDYKIYLHAEKTSAFETAKLYFDNLKVVY